MTLVTWLAIGVLGPGALGIFVWFLRDLRRLVAAPRDDDTPPA